MNINNFESSMDATILKRGADYYKQGYIESLDFDGDEWVADVSGSDDYTVTVKLSNSGDIISTSCDCPYDWGRYCKHQAAVFYAVRKELENPNNKSVNAPQRPKLEDILEKQDKSALIKILVEYAKKNKKIKNDLLFRFAEKSVDIIGNARNLIKASIKRAMRSGFVEYDDAEEAVEGARQVLEMAEGLIDDVFPCVTLCTIILEEMADLSGNCEDLIELEAVSAETVELLTDTIDGMGDDYPAIEAEKIFDLILGSLQKVSPNGIADWQDDLLHVCVPLCRLPPVRRKFEDYLRSIPHKDKYIHKMIQEIMLEIIKEFDGEEAVAAYNAKLIEGHKKRAYNYAVNGNFKYYLELKTLYTDDEWQNILEKLLKEIQHGEGQNIYIDILVHENMKEEILRYCETEMPAIVKLYKHLSSEYKEEAEILFKDYIRYEAENALNRKHYHNVCEIIKKYKSAFGSQKADEIKAELIQNYPKRRIFIDELNLLR